VLEKVVVERSAVEVAGVYIDISDRYQRRHEEYAVMTNPSRALQTALAYFAAWTSHDFDHAMTYLADDLVCHAPSGRFDGAEAFRGFMEPFSQILSRAEVIAAYGDDETALLMYDTDTVPCPTPRQRSA
jgi:hypothetical protein